jgi:hypothetical protein
MTIENLADNEYLINENTLRITGGGPLNQKISNVLKNPLSWDSIPPHEKKTGEVIFGVKESTPSFTLEFLDSNGKVVLQQEIGTIPVSDYTLSLSPSAVLPSGLLDSKNFSYVVENLDTPVKTTQYTQEKFTFVYHDGCISYPPEKFFEGLKGDCKDYATFLSYVLAEHSYDAKIISFKYYDGGTRKGHVVTLFTDTDGKMKYITTPDVTIFRNVNSVDDLLAKECKRLGVPTIANYTILPAGSLDVCVL